MRGRHTADAWERLKDAGKTKREVQTVANNVPNVLSYEPETDTIKLVSHQQSATGEEVELNQAKFTKIWESLRQGEKLSRPEEPGYTDLTKFLDGNRRASGIMGMHDCIFEEVDSETNPVHVWIPERSSQA